MSYEAQYASAKAMVTAKGSAVTFTLTHSATTQRSASTSTVVGVAIGTQGDPKRYAALGLVQRDAPTLLFVPGTQGQTPPLGATVTWGSVAYTVRDVAPVAPDGTAIMAYVVVAK